MTGEPRVADVVARTLARAGVRHAFGIPGGEVLTLLDALVRAGIKPVLARQESAAAAMATAAATLGTAPGLVFTTIGPGLTSAVNGVANAFQERTPLILLSGIVERSIRGRFTHQVVDHAAILRPVVKATFEVEAGSAAEIVERALRLALTAPTGPVHLDLAPDTAAQAAPSWPAQVPPAVTLRPAPAGDDPAVQALRERLSAAQRPIILAGAEAVSGGARDALRRLAERHGVPVVTTYRAKGIVDESLPGALGAAGLSPLADRLLLPLIQAADLVLLVGYDPVEMRVGWMDALGPAERVVEVSAFPPDHGMHASGLVVVGPCGPLLATVLDDLPVRPRWHGDAPAAVRAGLREAFSPAGVWGPGVVFETLAATLPPHAIVTADSGAHRILLSQAWTCREPLTLLQSSGYCTMGVAVPMAIGAALERPGCRCIAVTGDGGLEMIAGELATVRDSGLPVTVLVIQDESLGLIELKQRSARLPRAAVGLGRTDFARLGEAFGGNGTVVRSRDALRVALRASFARPGLSVVGAQVAIDAYSGRF